MKKVGLLVAAVGAALVGMFAFGGKANAQSVLPPGWTPPPGAAFKTSPANANATGLNLSSWKWRDQGALGQTVLIANASDPQRDFVAFFVADKDQARGILQQGTTANSGLIAQAGIAGLLS